MVVVAFPVFSLVVICAWLRGHMLKCVTPCVFIDWSYGHMCFSIFELSIMHVAIGVSWSHVFL